MYTTSVIDDWKIAEDGADWDEATLLERSEWGDVKLDEEATWNEVALLNEAERLAREAVIKCPNDYDTHWALAFVCLNHKKGGKNEAAEAVQAAKDEYTQAIDLNDNNMNLLAERAEALIYAGDFNDAILQVNKAKRVWDWHRWVLAWAYFCKGREDKIFYSLAHVELRQMVTHPYEDNYPKEVLLLSAAIHIQLKKVRQAKADMNMFLGGEKDWNIRKEMKSIVFKKRADEKHWLDALRKAGLPA